ncbi:MAG TPA: 3'-5' exonuclease, partial [Agitococcus sp.]|nr:3'-5' exonuclease [Agitococcus sp.]
LESDENLIRIITIHQSKGLEYPIVFVPTLWNPTDPTRNTPFYHQDDEAIFNLNPELDEQAQQALRNETLSEELRLGYVALTRAAQRCYIHWCPYESKDSVKNSPLGHWLVEGLTSLQKLQQQAPQLIALQAAEPVELPMLKINNQANTPMTVPSAPKVAWGYRLTSFSSLQQGAKALQTDYEVLEIKDDEGKEIVLEYEDQEVQLARFNFAGKKVLATSVGNCLHKIFEHADFTKPVADWQENIERQLKAHGIIASWQDDVVHWLNEVMQARLMANLRLSQLSHEHTLRELDFHLPLNQFQTTALIRCLQKYGIAVGELPYQTITGFLKGSIDLVFQHQGQYFIADYKSNHLGHQLDDYQGDKLHETMFSHGYNLQAAIYSLALHRWLSSQLRDYQPERHFGGVFYLFLRGMNVHGTEGIYHWQPNLKLLDELVDLLGSY